MTSKRLALKDLTQNVQKLVVTGASIKKNSTPITKIPKISSKPNVIVTRSVTEKTSKSPVVGSFHRKSVKVIKNNISTTNSIPKILNKTPTRSSTSAQTTTLASLKASSNKLSDKSKTKTSSNVISNKLSTSKTTSSISTSATKAKLSSTKFQLNSETSTSTRKNEATTAAASQKVLNNSKTKKCSTGVAKKLSFTKQSSSTSVTAKKAKVPTNKCQLDPKYSTFTKKSAVTSPRVLIKTVSGKNQMCKTNSATKAKLTSAKTISSKLKNSTIHSTSSTDSQIIDVSSSQDNTTSSSNESTTETDVADFSSTSASSNQIASPSANKNSTTGSTSSAEIEVLDTSSSDDELPASATISELDSAPAVSNEIVSATNLQSDTDKNKELTDGSAYEIVNNKHLPLTVHKQFYPPPLHDDGITSTVITVHTTKTTYVTTTGGKVMESRGSNNGVNIKEVDDLYVSSRNDNKNYPCTSMEIVSICPRPIPNVDFCQGGSKARQIRITEERENICISKIATPTFRARYVTKRKKYDSVMQQGTLTSCEYYKSKVNVRYTED